MLAANSGRHSRGASAVEFALVVPLLLLILLFMIDAGRGLFIQASLQNASNQAAFAIATGASTMESVTIAQEAAAGALAIAASGQAEPEFNLLQDCPPVFDGPAMNSAVVSTTLDFTFFTPIALIQRFDPGAADPGVIQITAQAQWLCAN